MLPKLLVAGALSAGLLFISTILSGILIGGTGQDEIAITLAFAIGAIVGSFVYVAIFLALSAATSRGLIIGLGYTLLWEGLLAGALPGTQLLSVREYVRGIVSALAPPDTLDSIVGSQGFLYAAIALVIVMVLGTYRLAVYEVRSVD
jgi:ABC-2 type transport system permease protein